MTVERDPIVEEVRRARREIEADCANDFGKIRERALRVLEMASGRIVSRRPVPLARQTGTQRKP